MMGIHAGELMIIVAILAMLVVPAVAVVAVVVTGIVVARKNHEGD